MKQKKSKDRKTALKNSHFNSCDAKASIYKNAKKDDAIKEAVQ